MIKINLSPKPIRAKRGIPWIIPIIILLLVLCYLLHFLQEKEISSLEREARTLQAQIEKFRVVKDSIVNLKPKANELKNKVAVFHSLDRKWYSAKSLLDRIGELRPEGVELKEISLNPEDVQVEGRAQANRHAAELVRKLKASKLFKEVELAKLSPLESGEGIEFILKAKR